MTKRFLIGEKKLDYYGDLLIKADLGLHSQIQKEVESILPKGGKILDFGAGEGALSIRLHEAGYKITSVDMDEKNFKIKNNDINFIKVNFNHEQEVNDFIKLHKESYDLVLGIEVIEHIENPWEYIRILRKLTKREGYILITTPNISSWLSRIKFLITGRLHSFSDADVISSGHITPVHESLIQLIFEREKINLVKKAPAGTLPIIWISKNIKLMLSNILSIMLRPFVQGMYDGYCILAIGKKK